MSQGYTYNAIAEHPIIPEFDDNEIKYKWNGALLNLSDLPVSEYTKTIFNVAGTVTGETEFITNTLTISLVNSGETYEVVAVAQYAPETNVVITLTIDGESSPVVLTLSSGSMSASTALSTPSSAERPYIISSSVTPSKDGTYIYRLSIQQVITEKFKAYYGVCPKPNISSVSAMVPTMSFQLIDADGEVLDYTIPPRSVKDIDPSQFDEYDNVLVLAMPKEVYEGGFYSLFEYLTPGTDPEFTKYGELTIDGMAFTIVCKFGTDTEFVSKYMTEATYQFEMKYKPE